MIWQKHEPGYVEWIYNVCLIFYAYEKYTKLNMEEKTENKQPRDNRR